MALFTKSLQENDPFDSLAVDDELLELLEAFDVVRLLIDELDVNDDDFDRSDPTISANGVHRRGGIEDELPDERLGTKTKN